MILPFKNAPVDIRDAPFHENYKSMKCCIDYAMPEGTPIVAIADGEIIDVEKRFSKSYDTPKYAHRCNMVRIEHKDGKRSLYAHLQTVAVEIGQEVKQGDEIGLSGQVGYATYPHLHFGLFDKHGEGVPFEIKPL